jgi:undecaprenyl-diphosphatase
MQAAYFEGMEANDFRLGALLRRVWPFFVVLAVFWVISVYWWATLGYHGTFRWLNHFHLPELDMMALYVFTHFADGLILPGIIFLLFWRKDPVLAITAFAAIMITGLLAQGGKLLIFTDWYRPPAVFEGFPDVEIVHPSPPHSRSFPSGHSTSAATGGLFFAYFMSQWRIGWTVLVGMFTVFVGFTRVIIGVHFPGDVFVGSIIGSVGGLLVLHWLYPFLAQRLQGLRRAQHGRVALLVLLTAVVLITGQFIHMLLVT